MDIALPRRAIAELVGSALLVAIAVGSGIAARRLSPADAGLQLLENSVATGAGLIALILAFSTSSGARFNPVVTLVELVGGGIDRLTGVIEVVAQVVGACAGAILANLMFELSPITISTHSRRRRACGSASWWRPSD